VCKRERQRQLHKCQLRRRIHGSKGKASLTRVDCGVEISLLRCEIAEVPEQLELQLERCVLRGVVREFEKAAALGDTFGQREVPPQGRGQPHRQQRLGHLQGIRECSPEVVLLGLAPSWQRPGARSPRS
jgi:hypothetical protein